MEDVKIVTIAELILRSQPISAASSIPAKSRRPITSVPARCSDNPPATSKPARLTDSLPIPRTLTVLNHSTIILGTITLPIHQCSSSPCWDCFQFSDGSSALCCDVLDFDIGIIGQKIQVCAWNFLPLRHGGGFLEIISWRFADSSDKTRKGLVRCSVLHSFPLISSLLTLQDIPGSRYCVYGSLRSVTPSSVVPLTNDPSESKSRKVSNSKYIKGFLVEIVVCECKVCKSKDSVLISKSAIENPDIHSLTKLEVLLFPGSASSWHPVITKLMGKTIMLSGLKKKLVFIGEEEEESHLMYVITENSALHLSHHSKKILPFLNVHVKGKGECGTYTGIITGVYLQGMVVEMDHKVLLLLTDQRLTPPHSLRVGAIICVRNVHFVNPKFSWTKVLILGACLKTSIYVESFSPLDTGSYLVSRSQSMLEKFIDSLPFSERLWVLLLVSSLCKKFGGILSEKNILGSKHKEGLAQMYSSLHISSSLLQTRHSIFRELYNHDSYCCGREVCSGLLKLVVPISYLICHCIVTWMRMINLKNDYRRLPESCHSSFASHEGRTSQSVRKVIPSEDIGLTLLGTIKISPSSGRLQLVDATGGIDVWIPDLPLTWSPGGLYEITRYCIIVEGIPEPMDCLGFLEMGLLSCRSIFRCTQPEIELNVSIHVFFQFANASCINASFYPCNDLKDDSTNLETGTYHLLQITHKFPVPKKFHDNPQIFSKSSYFVEAILLPWNLFLPGKVEVLPSSKVSRDQIKRPTEYCINRDYDSPVSQKRQKIVHRSLHSGTNESFSSSMYASSASNVSEKSMDGQMICTKISCLVMARGDSNDALASSGILLAAIPNAYLNSSFKPTARKLLLEFTYESYLKYQLLQIGGYYIIKDQRKDSFCKFKDSDAGSNLKVLINPGTCLWSLTFASDGILLNSESSPIGARDNLSFCNNGYQNEVEILQQSPKKSPSTYFDICLRIPEKLMDLLEVNFKELKKGSIQPGKKVEEVGNRNTETSVTGLRVSSGNFNLNGLLPEGNLVSLQGNVVMIHNIGCSLTNSCSSSKSVDVLRMKTFLERGNSFCVHVLVDHHLVRIFGSVGKGAFPVGFGSGMVATFHRILDIGDQGQFMFLPVSFISLRVPTETSSDLSSISEPTLDTCDVACVKPVCSSLISELSQCSGHTQIQLCCRVVAICTLVLERKTGDCVLQSGLDSTMTPFDIPFAGFMLDDGSSSCCCWANAERAATLLRLHENLPERTLESCGWPSKCVGMDYNASRTAASHIWRVLKNHKRIVVKNFGSLFDSLSQGLIFVTSDALSSFEEKILKFSVLNACIGGSWTVIGNVLDSNAIRWSEEEYLKGLKNLHSMQNIWAKEVLFRDPLTQTKKIIHELLGS